MSPTAFLCAIIALALYMAGMLAARTFLTWLYGKDALQYPDVRHERNIQVLFWLPLGLYNAFCLLGLALLIFLSSHSARPEPVLVPVRSRRPTPLFGR